MYVDKGNFFIYIVGLYDPACLMIHRLRQPELTEKGIMARSASQSNILDHEGNIIEEHVDIRLICTEHEHVEVWV